MPAIAAAKVSAKPATTMAPKMPPAIPLPIQKPRLGTPWLAAMTMPTISAASSTSRNTMIAVASTRPLLLNDEDAARGGMEIVEKLVASGFERADENAGCFARRDDLLAMQRVALEFGSNRLLIADDQLDLGIRPDLHFARHELVIPDRDRHGGFIRERRGGDRKHDDGQRQQRGGNRGQAHASDM